MTEATIRPMTPSDIPTVVKMIGALSAFHEDTAAVTAETLKRDTDPADPWFYAFVAEAAGEIMGYMILIRMAKVADGLRGIDINHMYVTEAARGTGIGRQMIATAKAHAIQLECSYMFISTAPSSTTAQKAYLACGFDAYPDAGGPRFRMQFQNP